MESESRVRVLVVANRTAATPRLLKEVGRRARAGPCSFSVLVPDATNRKAADWTLETALPSLERAARGKVEGLVGEPGSDPFDAVEAAVRGGGFDEIIVSTLPKKTSQWLRRDLIRRVEPRAARDGDRPRSAKLTKEEIAEDMGRFNAGGF